MNTMKYDPYYDKALLQLYATDNNHLWDLYHSKSDPNYLLAIPCDPASGREPCGFGEIKYVELYLPRRLNKLVGYTRISDGKQL